VLGWSEAFALFQIFYTPLRLIGLDMFLAADVTIVLLSLVGFATFVCLVRVAFRVQLAIALLGGLAFTFANNLWIHLYWFQLLVVWMLPGILLLAVLAFRAWPTHRIRSLALGTAAGLLAGLAFFTSYYVAWFASIAAAVAFLILLLAGRHQVVRKLLAGLRRTWWLVLAMGAAFVVGLVPFLLTYLPAEKHVHSLSYYVVAIYFGSRVRDLVNLGTGNYLWSSLIHSVLPSVQLSHSWLTYAVSPVVMVFAVAGSALAWWMTRHDEDDRRTATARAAVVLAATAVVLAILPVRTHVGGLWAVIWHIPGAPAIRRIGRIGVVTGLVASLAMVVAASVLYRVPGRSPWRSMRRGAILLLLLLAAVEQINTTPVSSLNRPALLAFLRAAQAPPRGCRSFYVIDPKHAKLPPSQPEGYAVAVTDQLDAMLISEEHVIPTINGYTSYRPPGWGLLDPFSPGYLKAVRAWVEAHHLSAGLCQFNLDSMKWQPASAAAGAGA
jgi:hypothetical protein